LIHEKLVLEGGGAVGIGALLRETTMPLLGDEIAVVLTGDNLDPLRLIEMVMDLDGR
jgi:threonine dehydratase